MRFISSYVPGIHSLLGWRRCAALLLPLLSASLGAQTGPTATPQQAPRTAPQTAQVLPSYEGQNVSSVELAGQPDLEIRQLLPLLALRAGEPFSRAKAEHSIAALQYTDKFQSVELEIRPEAGGVRVLFVLHPAVYFGIYDFPGALEKFAYTRLLQIADYPPLGPYTPVDVQNAKEALETFFRRDGYFQAQVRPEIQVDHQRGLANVTFHTELNKRAKFGRVNITGTSPRQTEHLQHVLRSWMARLRGSSIRTGKRYSLKTLQNATQYLNNALMKQGYLGAQVKLIGAEYDLNSNRADISFNVQTGPLIHVKVRGARLWPWTRRKLLPVSQQAGINPEIIEEGRQNLASHFQSKGYFDAKVTVQALQQPEGKTLLHQVTKGPRHKVIGVDVVGNQHLTDKQLMSRLAVHKAHFLSRGKFSTKLVQNSVKNLERVYQAEGFSSVSITPQVVNRNGNIVVTFRVNEGPQDIVEALRVEGNDTQPVSQLAARGLKLAPGQPYSQERAGEDRNQIMAQYLRLGYPNATLRQSARSLGKDSHRLEVVYHILEGPQVHTATIVTLGRRETRQRLIDRTVDLQVGAPLREDELLTSENKLHTLGVFDWAEVDPRRTITTQSKEDVVVKVHESKRNVITYGFGFEVINRGGSVPGGTVAVPGLSPVGLPSQFKTSEKTFYGPRGSFEYTRKNVRGSAETITVGGLAGRLDQRGSITYLNPHFRATNWASNLSVSGEHNSQNPIFTSRQAEFGLQLERALNRDKTTNLFLRYSLRQTGLTRLLIPDLVPAEDQHVRLSTLSGTFVRDTRDNPLDAHKGIYETVELGVNLHALGSSVNFARFQGQVAYYKKVVASIVWANSLRLGLEKPFSGGRVPLSEKFFSGGGSTLRGFPLNGAGPQRTIPACGNPADPSTCALIRVPVGGNQLFIVNSELRIPVPLKKGLGVVAFYDGGNVFRNIGFHGQYTNTIGLGIRYATPVGPVRIDIGHNLNGLSGIKSTQIFVTLGQAF